MTRLQNELANIDWNSVLLSGSMEECYTSFVKELNDLFDKCIPYKRVKSRKNRIVNPWMTAGL